MYLLYNIMYHIDFFERIDIDPELTKVRLLKQFLTQ